MSEVCVEGMGTTEGFVEEGAAMEFEVGGLWGVVEEFVFEGEISVEGALIEGDAIAEGLIGEEGLAEGVPASGFAGFVGGVGGVEASIEVVGKPAGGLTGTEGFIVVPWDEEEAVGGSGVSRDDGIVDDPIFVAGEVGQEDKVDEAIDIDFGGSALEEGGGVWVGCDGEEVEEGVFAVDGGVLGAELGKGVGGGFGVEGRAFADFKEVGRIGGGEDFGVDA